MPSIPRPYSVPIAAQFAGSTFPAVAHPPPVSAAPEATGIEKLSIWLLCAFFFLMFGRLADFFASPLHLPLVISVSAMAVAVLGGGIRYLFWTPQGLLMTSMTGWFLLVSVFSTHKGGSVTIISDHWMRSYLCFVLVLAICSRASFIRQVINTLAWSVFVAALLALIFGEAPNGRIQLPRGIWSGPNELAGAMVVGILYWIFILSDSTVATWRRVWSVVAMVPIGLVLMKTGSRGGLATLAVSFGLMFIRFSLARKVLVIVIGAMVLVDAYVFIPQDLRERYTTFFQSDDGGREVGLDGATESTASRLYLLERSIEITLRNPLFGVGPGQFAPQEDAAARSEGKPKGSWLGTHNTYTQVSSETGIPGLMLFVGILVTALRSTWWIQRNAHRLGVARGLAVRNSGMALQSVLIAYFVMFCFEHAAYLPLWPTLIGLIAALHNSLQIELSLLPRAPAAVTEPHPTPPVAPIAAPRTPRSPRRVRMRG